MLVEDSGIFIQIWLKFVDGHAPNRQQAINWTNSGLIYYRIVVSLGPDGSD